MGIPVLRGSGLEGFYCNRNLWNTNINGRDVKGKKVVNNVGNLSLWAP